MPKCQECRVNEVAHYTRWERMRRWFFRKFTDDIQDLKDDCYTRGFGEGYKSGFTHGESFLKTYVKESQSGDPSELGSITRAREDVPKSGPTTSCKYD